MTNTLIVYSDDDILVVNKPARLLTTHVEGNAEPTLLDHLRREGERVQAVHRLDRETTGLVVFARHPEAESRLTRLFAQRKIKKSYEALAQGWLTPPEGEVTLPIRDLGASACITRSGKPAVTKYQTIHRVGPCTRLRVVLETGRHNQIRLHLAHLGHPLVGERKFALGKWGIIPARRVMLHASSLTIPGMEGAADLAFTSPLPDDFQRALETAERTPCKTDPGCMSAAGLFTTERRQRQRRL